MERALPTLGASFNITEFAPHRDWIVQSNRDHELVTRWFIIEHNLRMASSLTT